MNTMKNFILALMMLFVIYGVFVCPDLSAQAEPAQSEFSKIPDQPSESQRMATLYSLISEADTGAPERGATRTGSSTRRSKPASMRR